MKKKSANIILRNTFQNHSPEDAEVHEIQPVQQASRKYTEKIRFFTDPYELLDYLNLKPEQVSFSASAGKLFPFKVPFSYAQNIKPEDPDDPLLRQVLPVKDELQQHPDFSHDPLDENNSLCQPGMLKKYHGRVLLLTTPGCAINCRYCFRRHYPYEDKGYVWTQINKNIALIAADKSITEVILSGGDPLSLSNKKIAQLLSTLESLPQIKRVRIHTRYPVVAPERITPELLRLITHSSLKLIMVLHINHPQELGIPAQQAISALYRTGMPIYNQSVLLNGINDNLRVLTQLSETLFKHNIQPYYLHLLDKISGSVHFDIDEKRALHLYRQLRAHLPGYMVPTLVREIAGNKNKTPFY
jgi:EF-P beta-lysylation protein EpmB